MDFLAHEQKEIAERMSATEIQIRNLEQQNNTPKAEKNSFKRRIETMKKDPVAINRKIR